LNKLLKKGYYPSRETPTTPNGHLQGKRPKTPRASKKNDRQNTWESKDYLKENTSTLTRLRGTELGNAVERKGAMGNGEMEKKAMVENQ